MTLTTSTTLTEIARARTERANAIADARGIEHAIASNALPGRIDTTLSEAIVLGLLRQGMSAHSCAFWVTAPPRSPRFFASTTTRDWSGPSTSEARSKRLTPPPLYAR